MAIDIAKLKAAAAATGKDMTKAQTGGGGGDYVPPAEGKTRLRFIGYIELGKQKDQIPGKPMTVKPKVELIFELSGPKHPPKVTDDGEKIPHRISITTNYSLNEKATFFKLFQQMNHAGKATHIVDLLGSAYTGTVYHRKYQKKDGTEGIAVDLKAKGGAYMLGAPIYEIVNEDGPTGDFAPLKVDPPISPIRAFLWECPDMEQWQSLYIDGEYPERKDDAGKVIAKAKSKNVFQAKIKMAENFGGSPIALLLASNGVALDIPDAEQAATEDDEVESAAPVLSDPAPPQGQDADDILNGVA